MVIIIATTLGILIFKKKFTTGWSTMAIITAKMIGTIMPLAIYSIANEAIKPMIRIEAFAYNGSFIFSSVMTFQYSLLFCGKNAEISTVPTDLIVPEF